MSMLQSRRASSEAHPAVSIQPLSERQLPQVSRFLTNAFGAGMLPAFVDPAFLEWKFFEPYPGWDAHRGYLIQQDDEIVAHACLWPSVFHCSSGEFQSSHILDWAASPSAAGCGITIYQHLLGLTEAAFVVGGSDQAKRLLPRLGFRAQGVQRFYAKVVRPWNQFRSRSISFSLREAARLARNTLWSLGASSTPEGWQAQPTGEAGEALDRLTSSWKPESYCAGKRSAAWLKHILRCPIGKIKLYNICRHEQIAGYFILNTLGGQCRIIDLFLDQESADTWRLAYILALQSAIEIPTVCEVVATASLPWTGEVLEGLGFRLRQEKPIFIYDPGQKLEGLPPLNVQMVDSDAFFLHDPSYPYLT